MIIDCDQHLYESRSLWRDYSPPGVEDLALSIEPDARGYDWLTWQGRRLELADVQLPGDTDRNGRHRRRLRAGQPAGYSYAEALPADYWQPHARVAQLDRMGVDVAMLFPNFGLLWERKLSGHLPALLANMAAWNRWCGEVADDGGGRLQPVAHLTLRDPLWLDQQLRSLASAGVRLAMVAAAPVDGKPLSHPDLDRVWSSFVEHGVTPCFHVAEQPRAFAEGWYADTDELFVSPLDSVMLSTPPAIAMTDLIVNGTLARHPDLRIGIIELGATWVPLYLMMLDGGWEFTRRINGRAPVELDRAPSDFFRAQVRVAAFSYEDPQRLAREAGELFMACSDYPHAEGTAHPLEDYAARGLEPTSARALFEQNAAFLVGTADGAVSGPAMAVETGWLAAQR